MAGESQVEIFSIPLALELVLLREGAEEKVFGSSSNRQTVLTGMLHSKVCSVSFPCSISVCTPVSHAVGAILAV